MGENVQVDAKDLLKDMLAARTEVSIHTVGYTWCGTGLRARSPRCMLLFHRSTSRNVLNVLKVTWLSHRSILHCYVDR